MGHTTSVPISASIVSRFALLVGSMFLPLFSSTSLFPTTGIAAQPSSPEGLQLAQKLQTSIAEKKWDLALQLCDELIKVWPRVEDFLRWQKVTIYKTLLTEKSLASIPSDRKIANESVPEESSSKKSLTQEPALKESAAKESNQDTQLFDQYVNEVQKALQTSKNQELTLKLKKEIFETSVDALFKDNLRPSTQKMWLKQAVSTSNGLEKKARGTEFYPDILYHGMRLDLYQRRSPSACKKARKLYVRYPTYVNVKSWRLDLQKAVVDKRNLPCIAAPADQKQRLRNLQYEGEFDEAKKELETLRSRAKGAGLSEIELMFANFLIDDGHISEAMGILETFKEDLKNDFQFVTLLAKAAVRIGDFQTAVSQYEKAYALSPRSKAGRSALLVAANLSLMSQDYDGAIRRFEEIQKKLGRASSTRDNMWSLGFAKLMSGREQEAYQIFQKLQSGKKNRKSETSSDQLTYWSGVALMKMERKLEAYAAFKKLTEQKVSLGYYALSAQNRLKQLRKNLTPQELLIAEKAKPSKLSGDQIEKGIENVEADLPEATPTQDIVDISQKEESESNSDLDEPSDKDQTTVAESSEDSTDPTQVVGAKDAILMQMKDPRINERFQRIQDLTALGYSQWLRSEMIEIERRTLNKEYLASLITEYEKIQAFDRSARLADQAFQKQRFQLGIQGAGRGLWQQAYPLAYDSWIKKYSNSYDVVPELVWSIMRAESFYKPTARSGVGALGLMQVMPFTAREVAKSIPLKLDSFEDLLRPEPAVQIGSRYLAKLYRQFGNKLPLAAAAYNAGPHRVEAWIKYMGNLDMDCFIEHIPFAQTRNYVKKVVQNWAIYSSIYQKQNSIQSPAWLTEPLGLQLSQSVSPREIW